MKGFFQNVYGNVAGRAMKLKEKMNTKMGRVITLTSGGIGAGAISSAPSFASPTPNPAEVDFSGVDIGFTPADLLSGSVGFYTLFIGFIVLVLAIKFAPALINFLFVIIGKARSARNS